MSWHREASGLLHFQSEAFSGAFIKKHKDLAFSYPSEIKQLPACEIYRVKFQVVSLLSTTLPCFLPILLQAS